MGGDKEGQQQEKKKFPFPLFGGPNLVMGAKIIKRIF
jgi:hypothetical protein